MNKRYKVVPSQSFEKKKKNGARSTFKNNMYKINGDCQID